MKKTSIATRLMMALGIGNAFQTVMPERTATPRFMPGEPQRFRRSIQKRARMKAEFDDLMAAEFEPPKHVKLARKAHMGEVGLPHGRRGMMVRRIDGRLRITS